MYTRIVLFLASVFFGLYGCSSSSSSDRGNPVSVPTNNNGNPPTTILTANFSPTAGILPFPIDLLLSGTADLTLNIPVADPTAVSDPVVSLNALDGFSTVAPWLTTFTLKNGAEQLISGAIDATSIQSGVSVRMFQVVLNQPGGGVVGVTSELTPGVDFVAAPSGDLAIAIVPLRPLDQLTSYMVIITDGVTDMAGNDATADQTYFLSKRTDPLVDASGQSTDPLLPDATANALEPLRRLTNSHLAAAASQGIDPDDIVVSWVATTQSITPVLGALRSTVVASPAVIAPSGLNTSLVIPGSPGFADIFIGTIDLPYYLDAPSATNPVAPLTTRWEAAPGAYVPPFDALGLDPTSTHLTYANPFPVVKSTVTVPVLLTIPNATSGQSMPDAGWPITIFQHGITRNRTDGLAIADAMAAVGYAMIAIDLPLHGITDTTNPLYAGNTPFAETEFTFDMDLVDNASNAPGPDGIIDDSGTHSIQLGSLLTSRDNSRQGQIDVSVLAATIPMLDASGDGIPDFDGANIRFVGQSLGAITGTVFLGVESISGAPAVDVGFLSAPGGGIPYLLAGSPTFGPVIEGGLAAAGIEPGSADFNRFLAAAQAVTDASDPINWAGFAAGGAAIIVQEFVGGIDPTDQVIPNRVAGAPLAGTEPLIAAMGLAGIDQSTSDANGIRVAIRYVAGGHGSILSPSPSLAAFIEGQTQLASFIASGGTTVVVTNTDVLQAQGQ